MSKVTDPKKNRYFKGLSEREEKGWELPKPAQEIIKRSKGIKLRHLISKVYISSESNASIVKEILGWLKDVKPIVVYKEEIE